MPNFGNIMAQSSFSGASGALSVAPTFYAATVGSSYSKALAASAGIADGTIIQIRVVSLTGSSLLTITPDGSDVIRHCGASLTSILLARLGGEIILRKRSTGWDVIFIRGRQKQEVWVTTPGATTAGQGTTNTKVRRYTVEKVNVGQAITYADSAAAGSLFTVNEHGRYAVKRTDSRTTATDIGASVDSSQLTTSINSITAANRLFQFTNVANALESNSNVFYFAVGAEVRPHDGTSVCDVTYGTADFRIYKVDE